MNIHLYSRKMQKDFHEDLDCYLEAVLMHQGCLNNCQNLGHIFFFQAAILQQTTEFIHNLQQEKAKVLAQNAYFKQVLSEVSRRCNIDLEMDISLYGGSPPLKRKKRDTGETYPHNIVDM